MADRGLLGIELLALGARGAAPIAAATVLVLAMRTVAWSGPRTLAQATLEVVLFLGCSAALTWATERALVRDLLAQVRARGASPVLATSTSTS